jgi:Holliday junction resolvase RusA-like endonuclease
MRIVFYGQPATKKNSMRLLRGKGGRIFPAPSKQYKDYERSCLRQLLPKHVTKVSNPVNVCCVYYMPTKRRVDLVNLLEASMDILVKGGVLADDNARIVAGHDGSKVMYDKEHPRVEIEIEPIVQEVNT